MNSRRVPRLLALCLLGAAAGRAQSPAPVVTDPSWSYVVTPSVVSQFMFRGIRLGGPAFEPSFEADRGNTALGVWTNFPLRDKVPGQSDPEIDFYGSQKFALSDAVTLQPGFTWYTFVNAHPADGFYRTTFEPSVALNWTTHGLLLAPKLYYDVVLKGFTAELNAAYALPLKELGTEIDFAATLGTLKWDTASAVHDPDTKLTSDYWLVGATIPYQLTKNARLSLGWAYTKGSNSYFKTGSAPRVENTAAVGRGVVTLSLAYTF